MAVLCRRIESFPRESRLTLPRSRASQNVPIIVRLVSAIAVSNEMLFDVSHHVGTFRTVPSELLGLCVKENHVMNGSPPLSLAVRSRAPPSDFALEQLLSEDAIEHDLQIVRGGGVAVEVERAGRFEDAVQFQQTVGHHREVGHDVVLTEERSQGLHYLGHVGVGLMQQFDELTLGLLAPVPRVLERLDLRFALLPLRRFEQQVVVAFGIERRIEIDQVHRLVGNALPQHVKVVAEIELIHRRPVCCRKDADHAARASVLSTPSQVGIHQGEPVEGDLARTCRERGGVVHPS